MIISFLMCAALKCSNIATLEVNFNDGGLDVYH